MNLPDIFMIEMSQLLAQYGRPGEAEAFFDSFDQPAPQGLRANRLKISTADLAEALSLLLPAAGPLRPVPWSGDGLYVPEAGQPGKLSLYAAGLYYIQEPSAMLPAAVLAAKPGEYVLDICAAPGGKSTRIAADLQGEGLLWANDLSEKRVRPLLRNLELTGCRNSVVTCNRPEDLASRLPAFFDAILVDAPCSGSGMFRRDPGAIRSYLRYGPEKSVPVQRSILNAAWSMLRPGGRLVYATCTFQPAENEANIAWFLDQHPDAILAEIPKTEGVSAGLPLTAGLERTARIWPHLAAGDGHFCALLHKSEGSGPDAAVKADESPSFFRTSRLESASRDQAAAVKAFAENTFSPRGRKKLAAWLESGWLRQERSHIHWLPAGFLPLESMRKVKTGLLLGKTRLLANGSLRFEPAQSWLMAMEAADFATVISLGQDQDRISRYLRGETINWPPGWPDVQAGRYAAVTLTVKDQPQVLGWARLMQPPMLKNLYPVGWLRPG